MFWGWSQFFWCEHGAEVFQVNTGIVATPIFRVDVPLSSQGIWTGRENGKVDGSGEGKEDMGNGRGNAIMTMAGLSESTKGKEKATASSRYIPL